MRVKRIGYAGMRTDDVDGMTRFFREVLGLEPVGENETVTFQRLPTHRLDLVEVFAHDHNDSRMIPDEVDFMIAFIVDDIREAMAEVQTAGIELVGEPFGRRGHSTIQRSRDSPVLRTRPGRPRLRDRAGSGLSAGLTSALKEHF